MKRIIITPAQLRMINEAVFGSEIVNGNIEQTIRDYADNNSDNLNEPVTFVDPNVTNNKENSAYNPNNPNDSKGSAQITVSPGVLKNMHESRYTKRQVELGRMLEMRRTGKIYSKKQLNEMFEKDDELMQSFENIVRNAYLHEVFEAVATEFGTDAEEKLKEEIYNGEGFMESLRGIFESADDEAKRNFLEKLSTKK